jgi:hypothetical protein
MSRRPAGALLFHPLTLASLFVLVLNDHYLKTAFPSALTGKLSDFSGMFAAPLVLYSAIELAVRRPMSPERAQRVLAACVIAIGLGFALPEVWAPADEAYRYGLAALRFPFRVVCALLTIGEWPAFRPVVATADVTDLFALPMGFLAFRAGTRADGARETAVPLGGVVRTLLFVALLALPRPCSADTPGSDRAPSHPVGKKGDYRHDGFFVDAALGGGLLYVDSAASVTNGFRQRIPSSATGASAPIISFALGATLRWPSFVLGLRVDVGGPNAPAVSTLGDRFSISEHNLEFVGVSPFLRYYPDPKGGLHFGAGVSFLTLEATEGESVFDATYSLGETQAGAGMLLEGGHGVWISRQFSAVATLRVVTGRVSGENGATLLFAPALFGGITWH